MITFLFQVKEKDSDEMIEMERATSLSSEEVTQYQGTDMIGRTTAADDEEALVILRSMESAVSHFNGDKNYLSAWNVPMMLLERFCVFTCKEIVDLASLKTRKVHLHSCQALHWDQRSTDMQLSWRVFVVSIFIDLFLLL